MGRFFDIYILGIVWDCADTLCLVLTTPLTSFLVRSSSSSVSNGLPTGTNPSHFIEKYPFQMSTLWTFITCSSISFVVDHSIRVLNRSYLRRSLMKLHVSLAKLFFVSLICSTYHLRPQSLSCWRCHTNYLHFSNTFFLLVPRNSFMFSLPSP